MFILYLWTNFSLNYQIKRTDLLSEKNLKNIIILYQKDNIKVSTIKNKKRKYRLINYSLLNNELENIFKNELKQFIDKLNNKTSVLIVGLGNENIIADSLGPKVINKIKVNLNSKNNIKISTLEPGVLSQTGINTQRIIKSIEKEIKADFLIIIDSLVSNRASSLEKNIQISLEGISVGSGLIGISTKIDEREIGKPIIVVGVPTALEIEINKELYLLSTSNIDYFINDMADLISRSINDVLKFY